MALSSWTDFRGVEHIPAASQLTERPDPNRRDSQIAEYPPQWQASRRWAFNVTDGTLSSRSWVQRIDPEEINEYLSQAQTKYGKENVKAIVLFVAPQCAEDQFSELKFHGFERCLAREGKVPHLAFLGPAKKWK